MTESKNAQKKLALYLKDHQGDESFPEKINYYDRFLRIDEFLNSKIHPNVNTGGTAREPIWLTDHGPEHIETVISRAQEMVFNDDECVLTPYEAYLLLVSIHFHDVGNLFGRKEHEKKVRSVMAELDPTLMGENAPEKRMICDIAMTHGGFVNSENDRDTISKLRYERKRGPKGIDAHRIASILRFADELADDRTRTNRFIEGRVAELFPDSLIHHAYASRLEPVKISKNDHSVKLNFDLNIEEATKVYISGDSQKYLFDEIFLRTLKMHREHVYCSRFMIPDILIERILVNISICSNDYSMVLGELNYSMEQSGYPDHLCTLGDICPKLLNLGCDTLVERVKKLPSEDTWSAYDHPIDLLVD